MTRRVAWLLLAGCLPGGAQEEVNAVEEGKKAFETYGCMVCHDVADDGPPLAGPSLYGLFLSEAREREVSDPESGAVTKVRADKGYFLNSVRKSWDALAVGERGEMQGKPYPAAMPMYSSEVVPDEAVEAIWHYLRTVADDEQAGPPVVMMKRETEAAAKSLLDVPNEVVVTTRTRVFRAPLRGSSARAVHVGLPNGMNYTFDPRVLSVRNLWGGGFLNLSEERKGRGRPGSVRGQGHRMFIEGEGILRPLLSSGEPVDFEFKEPDVLDHKAIERWLWEDRDDAELLASVDAEYLGHRLESATGDPVFRFRVGANHFEQGVTFADDGRLEIAIRGIGKESHRFRVSDRGLSGIEVTGGSLADGVWTLDPSSGPLHKLSARLAGGLVARPVLDRDESWAPQPLVTNTDKAGRQEVQLPAGYSIENWEAPTDLYGVSQLFEATGMAVAKDGTIVVATRTAGVWRIRDRKWTLFAEGTYEALGVWIEDEKGDQFVVMQKPELTRLRDTDGDGRADQFETVCDDYGFHGNYHEYAHGPVRDAQGNYYFTLNLSHGGDERTSWRAGGPFMGSMGGYRGWACRVTPEGRFEQFASGLRSPAGLGIDPDGRLWYAENQGEYVGSSKVVPLEQGKFYGHLSGLVSLPGKIKPDSPELEFENWKTLIRPGAVWLPHGRLANSPGHPAWDTTGGKFGVYQGHMFIGDQTLSTLLRVVTEQVQGADQGCVIPFARGMASGVMRPVFLPDGSLLVGQTGRGWGAHGGQEASLQRIIHDGETVAADILRVQAAKNGFLVQFTRPLAESATEETLASAWKIRSWFYANTGRYGSPELDQRDDAIERVRIDADRKSALVIVRDFGEGDRWLDRIYHLQLSRTGELFGGAPAWESLEAYFTLRAIP